LIVGTRGGFLLEWFLKKSLEEEDPPEKQPQFLGKIGIVFQGDLLLLGSS